MKALFNFLLTEPLVNTLTFLYSYVTLQDLGIAIILLTFIIRLILFPLFYKSFRNQAILQRLQPEVEKIQQLHKHDREKQALAMMELYKNHKVNPLSSFLVILIQLPVLIALYQLFLNLPAGLDATFLNFIDLKQRNLPIVFLAAALQYLQGKLSLPPVKPGQENQPSFKMAKNMVFLGPILTVVFLYTLPSAVGLYWLATTVFSIVQQIYINKSLKNDHGTSSTSN